VVALLSAEFGNLKTFATLSPIPGFRRWFEERIASADPALLTEEEAVALRAVAPADPALPSPTTEAALSMVETPAQTLARILARRTVARQEVVARLLDPVLLRAAARCLLAESPSGRAKRARDPVAHFHLSNGARVERLNPRGDLSEKGWRESAGMMVNYLYDPARIEEYHEDYAGDGRRAASSAVRKLAKGFV
jgi:malonyl-CoA decarboxylase